MKDAQRSIFRIEAIKRNSRSGGEAILPQFRSPRIIWLLWALIGLSLAGGLLLWLMRIPIYTVAIAVPLPNDASGDQARISVVNGNRKPLMAVLIPARVAPQVHVGQRVFYSFGKTEQRVSRTIIEIEPWVRSPHSLRDELGLRGQAAASITEPAMVAIVNLGPIPDGLPAASYVGGVYHAEVEVGTRRVISLLPLVGRFIGN